MNTDLLKTLSLRYDLKAGHNYPMLETFDREAEDLVTKIRFESRSQLNQITPIDMAG